MVAELLPSGRVPPAGLTTHNCIYRRGMARRTMPEATFLILTVSAAGSQHGYRDHPVRRYYRLTAKGGELPAPEAMRSQANAHVAMSRLQAGRRSRRSTCVLIETITRWPIHTSPIAKKLVAYARYDGQSSEQMPGSRVVNPKRLSSSGACGHVTRIQ
jgi:hypothetical protein